MSEMDRSDATGGDRPAEGRSSSAVSRSSENRTGNPGSGASAVGAGRKVPGVHRLGALLIAAVLATFGVLGFAGGLGFFDTEGRDVAGLSSNGLLSTLSVVTAGVLVLAVLRSPRTASTIMILVGLAFLVSAFVNLGLLNTDYNFLAFRLPNVFFSIGAGLVLLILGAYGRVSGNLPEDAPYRDGEPEGAQADAEDDDDDQGLPETAADVAAEEAMRDAELAVVNHTATPEQARLVEAMSRVRTRRARREVWLREVSRPAVATASPAPQPRASRAGPARTAPASIGTRLRRLVRR